MVNIDNAFADPRLIALYDPAQGSRPDLIHYERLARELGAASVLDIGCGTGTLACRLAIAGLQVVGVDPAHASLEVARTKKHAGQVQWVLGDATTLPELEVDLAVMTGNVAQVFLTDNDWAEMLTGVHQAVAPGGFLVFEVRDPAYRGWEEWTPEFTRVRTDVDGVGQVEIWCELVEVDLPLVSFRWNYRFLDDGVELQSTSTLRFRERDEIEASLAVAGYQVAEVRDAPDRPNKEFVFIAQAKT